jgi:hypothetical protein
MQQQAPAVGTIEDGFRFKGGDPSQESSWEAVGPRQAPAWGPGAVELPDGSVVRYGPRGGTTVLRRGGEAATGAPADLTEAQGKAVLYGGMMAGAERDYQRAREDGYDPGSFRNQAAAVAGVIPFDGDFFGRLIRDDVSDRGVQAERRWAEGNLRQLTGAAATQPEISRVAAINFDRGNDELSAQRYQSRADTYAGTRVTAGPGASTLPDYPGINRGAGPVDPATGLPTYPGITARVAGAEEIPLTPAGGDPNAPGSQGNPIDLGSLGPDELLALQPGQFVRRQDGTVYALPSAPFRDGSMRASDTREGAAVVRSQDELTPEQRGWTPESAVAQRREMNPILRTIDAFGRGAADTLSFEWADEGAAAADAALGQGVGRDFGTRYGNNLRVQRAVDEADGEDVLWARRAGNVAGALVPGAQLGRTALALVRGQSLRNALRMGVTGFVGGGVAGAGAGDGSVVERAPGAGAGALTGAVVAPVATALGPRVVEPIANAAQSVGRMIGRNTGRAMTALGIDAGEAMTAANQPNTLTSAVGKFARRINPDPQAMRAQADEMASMAMEPTLADLTDAAGRGVLRAAATRQTPARQAAQDFAERRAEDLQDRVSTQARRTISDDPRSPDEIRTEVAARRTREGDAAFGAVRNELLTPEPQIVEALRTPAGRRAVEDAAERAANRGDIETANQLRQLAGDALDNPAGVQITVGMADRIARTLNGLGEARKGTVTAPGDNDAAASFFRLAEALRGTARRQVDGYDQALKAYGDDSRLIQAATLGEQFMRMEADQFAAAVARMTPDEIAIARAAARRSVERAAGTQGQAPGVAQRLSGGREQGIRNRALLDDPETMQRAMRAERDALMAARETSPGTGSPTARNMSDIVENIGDVAGAAREAATGNLPGLIGRFGRRFVSRGFSDAESEALVMAAIDPARTREVIDMLAERMSRTEARQTVRAIRRLSAQGSGATAASNQTGQ